MSYKDIIEFLRREFIFDISKLNPFSASIASKVFTAYPEWKKYARLKKAGEGGSDLFIDVPAPQTADTRRGLIIYAHNKEITVSFDCYHVSFDRWEIDESGFEQKAALPFVKSILSENIAVVSWWNDKKFCQSCQVIAGEKTKPRFAMDYDRVRVRSWHGHLNKDRIV